LTEETRRLDAQVAVSSRLGVIVGHELPSKYAKAALGARAKATQPTTAAEAGVIAAAGGGSALPAALGGAQKIGERRLLVLVQRQEPELHQAHLGHLVTAPSHRSCHLLSERPVASRSRSYRLVSGNGNQDSRRTIQLS